MIFFILVFKQANIRVSMFDRAIVTQILSLVGQYCPDVSYSIKIFFIFHPICMQLLILSLANNRLQRLDMYADLVNKCPNLEMLDLSDNGLKQSRELENISGLKKLSSLSLLGNPPLSTE